MQVVSGQGLDTTLTNSVVADAGSYDVVAVTCTRGSDIKSGDGDGIMLLQRSQPNQQLQQRLVSRTGIQTLTVSTTGTNLTYSWRRRNSINKYRSCQRSRYSTLTLTNSVVADAGSYDVVVSGTLLRQ
jgi:hypothetical protein